MNTVEVTSVSSKGQVVIPQDIRNELYLESGSKLIVVLGHTSCGAVKGACDNAELGNLTQMLQKISPAVDSVKTDVGEERNSKNLEFVNRVAQQNVNLTIENIKKNSPVLNEMLQNNEINIVGAMYSVETGEVKFQ